MRINLHIIKKYFLVIIGFVLVLTFCEKPERDAQVVTLEPVDSLITYTNAKLQGEVTDKGSDPIEDHGIIVSENDSPDKNNSTVKSLGTRNSKGVFQAQFSDLANNTTYYYCAYISVNRIITYGETFQFRTKATQVASVTAGSVSEITLNSAKLSGNVASDGGETVTKRGLCWNTTPNPTVTSCLDSTVNGSGTGAFTGLIHGLAPTIQYYVRAYAINAKGVSYNNSDITFTTYNIPTVTTTALTSVTGISAVSGGNITNEGGVSVTARGVCWSASPGPNIALSTKTSDGTGSGSYSSNISGLTPGTTYYVRAYATNQFGTGYGNERSFTATVTPSVITDAASAVASTAVVLNGRVNANNSSASVTFEYGLTASYGSTIAATPGTVTGNVLTAVTAGLPGLTQGTTYHFRIKATNTGGTAYGDDLTFTTTSVAVDVPTISTSAVTSIAQTSASGGGNITSEGGASVSAKGVCWSTSPDPTIADNKTSDGTGSGAFSSNLTGLAEGTLYHVRAYATNSFGTSYGEDRTFTTLKQPEASTTAATNIGSVSVTLNGTVNANNSSTTVTFEYGLTASYGITVNASQSPVTGSTATNVSINITGLTPATTYHFRVAASSAGGTSYGNDLTFVTKSPGATVTDIDGNIYNIITIGTQVWMAENLKTTRYRDGTAIPNVIENTSWYGLTTGAYSNYNHSSSNIAIYGRLYNYYATVDNHNLCPTGWHVPTYDEWSALITYLGGAGDAGGKLKETGTSHWLPPNTGATNETLFTALPGGWRNYDGTFVDNGSYGQWWSSSETSVSGAWHPWLSYDASSIGGGEYYKVSGFSIRCIQGEGIVLPVVTTAAVSNIEVNSAVSGGSITSNGGAAIIAKGVCWNTISNPTTDNFKTADGTGMESFVSNLTSLTGGTTYYVRAYATNSIGTAYGNEISFNTSPIPPVLTTSAVTSITQTTAVSGGSITSNGGAAITGSGVCWSTSENPTIADNKTTDNPGTGTFTSNLTALTLSTVYYVRAYATNSAGTSYGEQMVFKTLMAPPVSGLLAYYPFSGNPNDESGNNNNGVLYGASLTNDYNRNPNSAYYFDGTGKFIHIPMVNWPAIGTGDFAISAWINPLSFNDYLMIVCDDIMGNFQFLITPGGEYLGIYLAGTGFSSNIHSFTASNWYHVVAMRQSGSLRFYVNGQEYGAFASNESVLKSSFIDIGLRGSTGHHPFHGSIDQVQIYNRALTLTEINQFYQGAPFVSTLPISLITSTTAVSGGNITSDRGAPVTARGVCWSTSVNPTVTDAKTTDGTGMGEFSSNLTGLTAGTVYHVRAYATNSFGTSYGEDRTFTSLKPPEATTAAATNTGSTSATLNGIVNANNSLTAVTFEYGTTNSYGKTVTASQSPLTGSTATNVSVNITGLTAGTTYHFRVVASSAGGTVNGNDLTFTTN